MTLSNDSVFIRSLRRLPVSRTPVWMMRQAGRYLPEYRQTRQKAGDFLSLCKNHELACEVTLQPLRRFSLDAAILFSDILTIPDAMGLGLYFVAGEGPKFHRHVRCEKDLKQLVRPKASDELNYVMQAVRTIRRELDKTIPLIGFAGSPWTIAAYMVEGQSTREFKWLKNMAYDSPALMHALLDCLSESIIDYCLGQIAAGVDALMLFDTWGGILPTPYYETYSLAYMTKIVQAVKQHAPDIPVILFTKGGGLWLELMADSGCDALGLDWTCELGQARSRVGDKVALQGNMDPAILRASPATIQKEVQRILKSYGHGHGHVFNLGHGITPDVSPDNAKAMIDAVHEYSVAYHTLS